MIRRAWPFVLMSALLVGCPRRPAPVVVPPNPAPVVVEMRQGLTQTEREQFYHLAMGSEIVPLSWLRALESATTGKPFLDNVDRFGLIADPGNADGLPVGLSAAPSRDLRFAGKMVGFNCAACHTGELTYQGKSLRVDGGSSLFDAEAFTTDLITSLAVTFKSPEKLVAFVKRQLQDKEHADRLAQEHPGAFRFLSLVQGLDPLKSAGDLEKAVADKISKLHDAESQRSSQAALESGLQLTDDAAAAKSKLQDLIGTIETGNIQDLVAKEAGGALSVLKTADEKAAAIKDTLTHIAESMRLLRARLDFARKVATLGKLKLANTHGGPGRVDDFGAARDLLFDVKFARAMTAPCSVPHLWGTASMRWTNWDNSTQSTLERSVATALAGGAVFDPATYKSTVMVKNVGQLELLAAKFTAPAWPEDIFGKVDRAKAERGGALFKKWCAECHVDPKRPADLAADKDWPPDMLFDLDKIGTDPTRARNYAEKLGERPFADAVQEVIGKYLDQAASDEKVPAADIEKYRAGHKNVWRTPLKYAARPLAAVWATPPYLHNGSVPTLYDLLLPADKRPATFPLGQREFDPVKVGYAAVKGTPIFTFDTKLKGNSNAGHEYGTTLSDEQRYELVEYLKAN